MTTMKNYMVTLVSVDQEEDGNTAAAKLWSFKINVRAEHGEAAIAAAKAALKNPGAVFLRDLEYMK